MKSHALIQLISFTALLPSSGLLRAADAAGPTEVLIKNTRLIDRADVVEDVVVN